MDSKRPEGPRGAALSDPPLSARRDGPDTHLVIALRRELAQLYSHVAELEEALEAQQQAHGDTLDRLDVANERLLHFEAELRGRRAASEAPRMPDGLRVENAELRAALEEARRSAGTAADELAEVRKRQFQNALRMTDKETESAALQGNLDRVRAELRDARREIERLHARDAGAEGEPSEPPLPRALASSPPLSPLDAGWSEPPPADE